MQKEKERRDECERVRREAREWTMKRKRLPRAEFKWALYLPRRFMHLPKGCFLMTEIAGNDTR